MSKEQLMTILLHLAEIGDPEEAHARADDALLEYIADEDITRAYNAIEKWYA